MLSHPDSLLTGSNLWKIKLRVDRTRLLPFLMTAGVRGSAAVPSEPTEAVPSTPTLKDMKQRLAAAIPVDESELRALARQRAEQVRNQ